jgi:hypothetical protein
MEQVCSPFLFNNSYDLPVLTKDSKCPNQVFHFDCPIYRLFVINMGWNRDSIQRMIFVNVCSTWSMVELKTRFQKWLTRNDVNGVSLFHLSNLTTLMACLCSQRSPKVQIMYFVFGCSTYRLCVLNTGWKRDFLQIIIFVYVCFTRGMFELITRFEMWITRNDVNGVGLLHLSYLTTLMAYQYSRWAPNVEIMYFMFHWSIYRLFVLNRGWKRDSLQMRLIVNFCTTCNMVELKAFPGRE